MSEKHLTRQVGELIRQLRTEMGLSQESFADLCDLHRTYVGSIERGEKTITIETANKITQALGLSLSEFFKHLEQKMDKSNKSRS